MAATISMALANLRDFTFEATTAITAPTPPATIPFHPTSAFGQPLPLTVSGVCWVTDTVDRIVAADRLNNPYWVRTSVALGVNRRLGARSLRRAAGRRSCQSATGRTTAASEVQAHSKLRR